MEQIVLHFGLRPDRDAFADAGNARFERWYGPGSVEGEDAFERDWGEELLWINPPFNMFNKVLDKIQSDRAHAILIIPRWSARVFLRRAWGMAVDFLEFPKGTPMFERGGKEMKGTSWDTYAMLVCGHYPKCSNEEMRAGGVPPQPPRRLRARMVVGWERGGPLRPVIHGGGVAYPLQRVLTARPVFSSLNGK